MGLEVNKSIQGLGCPLPGKWQRILEHGRIRREKHRETGRRDNEISIYTLNIEDYIFITDIARYKDPDKTDYIIQNWLRNTEYHRIPGDMGASQ